MFSTRYRLDTLEHTVRQIDATLPTLATKADVAALASRIDAMPGRTYFLGVVGLVIAAQAALIGMVALLHSLHWA
jgi:hypothetical protein